jgi:UDP-2,4-diacetamido-2,4,6-trideoxy-beta-L-altropyranose hydrolase
LVQTTNSLVFLFRADATPAMGTGHVMRCLALAEGLHDLGHRCHFLLGAITPALDRRLREEGIVLCRTQTIAEDETAQATCRYAKTIRADGIIADGYQFDPVWRRQLRSLNKPILSFYDHDGQSADGADIVVNAACDALDLELQNATSSAVWLIGSPYMLLRRDLREALAAPSFPVIDRRSILVTFGGSDPAELTLPVAAALRRAVDDAVKLDIVIGGSVAGAAELAGKVQRLGPGVQVHVDPPLMGSLMSRAGLAVSAAGTTAGELEAFAIPSLITVVADNQLQGARRAASRGWCRMLDARWSMAAGRIADEACALWLDASARRRMSQRRGDIDGKGVERVCEALLGLAAREN